MKKSEIKREARRLMALLRDEDARHKAARSALVVQIQAVRGQCDHKGQETGYNERDGSWGNACPTCGYSY